SASRRTVPSSTDPRIRPSPSPYSAITHCTSSSTRSITAGGAPLPSSSRRVSMRSLTSRTDSCSMGLSFLDAFLDAGRERVEPGVPVPDPLPRPDRQRQNRHVPVEAACLLVQAGQVEVDVRQQVDLV